MERYTLSEKGFLHFVGMMMGQTDGTESNVDVAYLAEDVTDFSEFDADGNPNSCWMVMYEVDRSSGNVVFDFEIDTNSEFNQAPLLDAIYATLAKF